MDSLNGLKVIDIGEKDPRSNNVFQSCAGLLQRVLDGLESLDRLNVGITHARDITIRLNGCGDRKSTRLNSSHLVISYAVFCLKKKKKTTQVTLPHNMKKHHLERNPHSH